MTDSTSPEAGCSTPGILSRRPEPGHGEAIQPRQFDTMREPCRAFSRAPNGEAVQCWRSKSHGWSHAAMYETPEGMRMHSWIWR